MSLDPDRIMLRQGATSHLRAEVWCSIDGGNGDLPVDAVLEGPFSDRGRTLTSRFSFTPSGEHTGIKRWRSILPEPVFWTPRMPAYYELRGVPGVRQRIGLRELFVRQQSFFREDRRWVPRAAFAADDLLGRNPEAWTNADLVPIVFPVGTNVADDAVGNGLPLIVDLTTEFTPASLLRYIPFASIIMVVLPSITSEMIPAIQYAKSSHLLVGVRMSKFEEIPAEAQFAVVSEGLLQAGWRPSRRLPLVVTREWDIDGLAPGELRAMCDRFQAELDRGADYAGLWLFPKTVA